jgi:hypothetical protein
MAEQGIKEVEQKNTIPEPVLDFDPLATTFRGEVNRPPRCNFCHKRHGGECLKKAGKCFKCEAMGHFVKECSLAKRPRTEEEAAMTEAAKPQRGPKCNYCKRRHFGACLKRAGKCFRCGAIGHFIKDCPKKVEEDGSPRALNEGNLANQKV